MRICWATMHCVEVLHISAHATSSCCAVCWEWDTSWRRGFTENVKAVCTVCAEQIWCFLEAVAWYQIDMNISAPGTWKYGALRVSVLPGGIFTAFPCSRTVLQGLICLGKLSILGLLGGSVQDSIIMPCRLFMNSLLEFTSDDCKCGEQH